MTVTLHLKDQAHIDVNIWPLSIWYHCQEDHSECGFRYESGGSFWKAIWDVDYLLGCLDLLGSVESSLSISLSSPYRFFQRQERNLSDWWNKEQRKHSWSSGPPFRIYFISLTYPYPLWLHSSLLFPLFSLWFPIFLGVEVTGPTLGSWLDLQAWKLLCRPPQGHVQGCGSLGINHEWSSRPRSWLYYLIEFTQNSAFLGP